MKTVNVKIEDIKPYKNNAKKHTAKQIEQVADSINRFGFVQPIILDKNNEIVIGHCRLEACKKLDKIDVPCVYVDTLSDKEVKALRLADNKLNESDWDMDLVNDELELLDDDLIELTGFDIDNIDFSDIESNADREVKEKTQDVTCPNCLTAFKV